MSREDLLIVAHVLLPIIRRRLFTLVAAFSFLLFVPFLFMWCFSYQSDNGHSLGAHRYVVTETYTVIESPILAYGWPNADPPFPILISLGFSAFLLGILPTLWLFTVVRRWALSPPRRHPVARGFPVTRQSLPDDAGR
jgi:hypothetical protein